MTPPHSLTPSYFLKSRHCAFLKIFFSYFSYSFFAACVNPRLVRSEPEPNRTNRNRFCSVPRFAKNRSVPICREPNLCHKPKNRTDRFRLTERPGLLLLMVLRLPFPNRQPWFDFLLDFSLKTRSKDTSSYLTIFSFDFFLCDVCRLGDGGGVLY